MEPHVAFEGNAADAAVLAAGAAAVTEHPIHQVLRTCGITNAAMRATFIDIEGLDTLTAFAQLNGDADISEMAKRMSSRSIAPGRVILGTMHIKRLQALVYWVKDDHDRRGLIADPDSWDEDTMAESMERCTTLYRATISSSKQYTLLLVSTTTVVPWPGTVVGYTGRLVIQ